MQQATGVARATADVAPAIAGQGTAGRAVPRGGFQCTSDDNDGSTTFTCSQVPPELFRMAKGAQQTAFGLLGIIAAIIILGPFARMFARRVERKAAMEPSPEAIQLRQQIAQLQQSVDSMSIEVERISESQRFQSKLLYEAKNAEPVR